MNATVPAMKLEKEEFKILAKINQEIAEYEENLEKLRQI